MKSKLYKLLSSVKLGLFALALIVFSGTAYSQTTYTFNYTGSTQTISLAAGSYSVKCWGADGGRGFHTSQIANGGKGGYSFGTLNLTAAQTISIYVGGVGTDANGTTVGQICAGGFNGGGSSGTNNYATVTQYRAGGGGGGSDVRVGGSALTDRVIVAGGGGGGIYSATLPGGNGGGTSGGNGGNTYNGGGGTQTAGGIANGSTGNIAGTNGALGLGGNGGTAASKSAGGGGGGGYYGGGGGATGNSSSSQGSGGGGSGYIGGVTSGITYSFSQTGFVTNPDPSGNGRVLITELCSISLSVTGVNSSGALCSGNTVTITTNAISNYSWSTGATTSSLVVSPTSNTVYALTATSPSNCTAGASVSLSVTQGLPTLTVTNSTSGNGNGVCANGTATLTASGAVTYTWTSGVSNGISFTPAIASSYTVTGENGCGTTNAVTSISIHPSPTLAPISVANPTMCSGTSNTLTASASGVSSYSWSTSSTASFITVSPSANTIYTVKVTNSFGCANTAATTVTVFTAPVQTPVASPAVICLGQSSTLTAVGSSFTWTPGNAGTSSIVVTPNVVGVHTFTVIKANSTCADTKTLSITVNALPVISAQANPTIVCESVQSATLSGNGGTSYTWAPAGGNASTAVITASANTIFTLTGDNGVCVGSNTVQLAVSPLPTIVASAASPFICFGQGITLTVTGGATYSWSPSGFTTPILPVNPTVTTQYSVTGTSSAGCSSSSAITVTVYPVPILNMGINNPVVCSGNTVELTVSGANTYSWSTNSSSSSVTVTPAQSTIYSVIGTNTLGNCISTGTVMVDVFIPSVNITGNNIICVGETATLTANAIGALSYSWSTGLPVQTILVSPTITALYVATANVSTLNIACPAINSVTVTVKNNPNIVVIPNSLNICENESVSFSAAGGTTYVWSWGSQTSSATSITITPSQIANLIVNVTGTGTNGCKNTSSVTVLVNSCSGIDEASFSDHMLQVYPNPSHGEINVAFDPIAIGSPVELLLINETGQLVRQLRLNEENGYKASISELSNGIYFITGRSGTRPISEKIVIAR